MSDHAREAAEKNAVSRIADLLAGGAGINVTAAFKATMLLIVHESFAAATAELTAERDALREQLAAAEKSFRETIEQEVERAGKLEDELNAVDLCKQAIAHQHHEIERLTRKLAASEQQAWKMREAIDGFLGFSSSDKLVSEVNEAARAALSPDAGRLACEERERLRAIAQRGLDQWRTYYELYDSDDIEHDKNGEAREWQVLNDELKATP